SRHADLFCSRVRSASSQTRPYGTGSALSNKFATMKSAVRSGFCGTRGISAFTITETVVAMGLLALVSAGLYGGVAMSFRNVQMTREEVRASQINVQTLEVLRLCTWSQSSPTTNFLPTSFAAPSDASGNTNLVYHVQVTI